MSQKSKSKQKTKSKNPNESNINTTTDDPAEGSLSDVMGSLEKADQEQRHSTRTHHIMRRTQE